MNWVPSSKAMIARARRAFSDSSSLHTNVCSPIMSLLVGVRVVTLLLASLLHIFGIIASRRDMTLGCRNDERPQVG